MRQGVARGKDRPVQPRPLVNATRAGLPKRTNGAASYKFLRSHAGSLTHCRRVGLNVPDRPEAVLRASGIQAANRTFPVKTSKAMPWLSAVPCSFAKVEVARRDSRRGGGGGR